MLQQARFSMARYSLIAAWPVAKVLLLVAGFAVLMLSSSVAGSFAADRSDTVVVTAGISDSTFAAALGKDAHKLGYALLELPAPAIELARQLKAEIENDDTAEDGPHSPPHLDAFSDAVLAAIPSLFTYRHVRVISEEMLPLEMVRRDRQFLGDIAEISHEFPAGEASALLSQSLFTGDQHKLPLSRYFIDAVMGMDPGVPRASQDIVQVALKLESEIPVDLSFGGGDGGRLAQLLTRDELSILHIDTHGGPDGRTILVSRAGTMLGSDELPASVRVPVVLLFGCQGVANRRSFGSVLRARGAQAVISSLATFKSYGLTGDAARERLIYEAFFAALKSGDTIGKALVALRQTARREGRSGPQGATLTRLMFVLVGRDDLAFAWGRQP
jgi:hypothetical protein